MKKIIIAAALLAVAGSQVSPAKAGDREWAVVGKVLTGIAAVDIISHAVAGPTVYHADYCAPAPVVYQPAPPVCYTPAPQVYYAPQVVYRPAPVVYAPAPVVVAPRYTTFRPAPVVVRPVVRVGYGFGHRDHPGHGGRW